MLTTIAILGQSIILTKLFLGKSARGYQYLVHLSQLTALLESGQQEQNGHIKKYFHDKTYDRNELNVKHLLFLSTGKWYYQ